MSEIQSTNGHQDPLVGFKTRIQRILDQVDYSANPREDMPWFPQYVHIEPTNACNLRCTHCHHARGPNGENRFKRPLGFMDLDLFKKLIDQIAPTEARLTLDLQGEPLLHRRILDMVAYAKENGVFTSIITNAVRLKSEVAERLIELNLDRIVFSFDSIRKDVYESIRILGRFEPTLLNILRYIRLNHDAGHPTHICMSTVYQKRNQAFADEYREFFIKLPVDRVFINPMLNLAGVAGTEDEIDLEAARLKATSDQPICKVAWETITVNWDGIVSPCPVDVNVLFNAGDANEQSLEEIWNGEKFCRFRKAHLTGCYEETGDGNGHLCDHCNSLWNPEYDLRNFREHAVEAIEREASMHAQHLLKATNNQDEVENLTPDQKYQYLLDEIKRVEMTHHAVLAEVDEDID